MSLTHNPPVATSVEPRRDDELDPRIIADTVRRIARDHPSQPLAAIELLVGDHLSATREAKVRSFRLLLAERSARQHLGDPDAQPPPSGEDVDEVHSWTQDGTR